MTGQGRPPLLGGIVLVRQPALGLGLDLKSITQVGHGRKRDDLGQALDLVAPGGDGGREVGWGSAG